MRLYSATVGSYSGNITHASSGATTKNVAASGTVSLCADVSLVVSADTHMRSGNSRATYNYGGSTTVRVNPYYLQGGTDDQLTGALFKWVLTSVPSAATVETASMTFYVEDSSTYAYSLYNMRQAWVEGTNNGTAGTGASWNFYGAGTGSWGTTGAQNTSSDRYDTNLWDAAAADFGTAGSKTFTLNAAGIAAVQGWVTTPGSNNGVTLQNYSGTSTDHLGGYLQ